MAKRGAIAPGEEGGRNLQVRRRAGAQESVSILVHRKLRCRTGNLCLWHRRGELPTAVFEIGVLVGTMDTRRCLWTSVRLTVPDELPGCEHGP